MITTKAPRSRHRQMASSKRRVLTSLALAAATMLTGMNSSPASASQHLPDIFTPIAPVAESPASVGLPLWVIGAVILGSAVIAAATTLVTLRLRGTLRQLPA